AFLADGDLEIDLALDAEVVGGGALPATMELGLGADQRLLDRLGLLLGVVGKRERDEDERMHQRASNFGLTCRSTQSMISWVDAPGLKSAATPMPASALTSASGTMPPPKTTTSEAPRALSASITAGKSVMCAPDMIDSPTASTSSCTAADAIIS